MAAKNDNITKDPVAAAKKGAKTRTGKKRTKTIIKEALGLNDPVKLEALKNKIDELTTEFLNARDKATKMAAWREITKYVHAQKKTLDISGTGGIQLTVYLPEKKPLDPEEDKKEAAVKPKQ